MLDKYDSKVNMLRNCKPDEINIKQIHKDLKTKKQYHQYNKLLDLENRNRKKNSNIP